MRLLKYTCIFQILCTIFLIKPSKQESKNPDCIYQFFQELHFLNYSQDWDHLPILKGLLETSLRKSLIHFLQVHHKRHSVITQDPFSDYLSMACSLNLKLMYFFIVLGKSCQQFGHFFFTFIARKLRFKPVYILKQVFRSLWLDYNCIWYSPFLSLHFFYSCDISCILSGTQSYK